MNKGAVKSALLLNVFNMSGCPPLLVNNAWHTVGSQIFIGRLI